MDTLSGIVRQHTNKHGFAADIEARQVLGERILDHDAFLCGCGCGRVVNVDEWDAGGAEWLQPTGFYDDSCMRWFTNECGDPKKMLCEGCVAYKEAEDLVNLATTIRDSLSVSGENAKAAHDALRRMVGVESPLGRRLRKMIAKSNKPQMSTESCDPKTCRECLQGAA